MIKIYFETKDDLWAYIFDNVKNNYRVNHKEIYVEIDDRDHNTKDLIRSAKKSNGYVKYTQPKI